MKYSFNELNGLYSQIVYLKGASMEELVNQSTKLKIEIGSSIFSLDPNE